MRGVQNKNQHFVFVSALHTPARQQYRHPFVLLIGTFSLFIVGVFFCGNDE